MRPDSMLDYDTVASTIVGSVLDPCQVDTGVSAADSASLPCESMAK